MKVSLSNLKSGSSALNRSLSDVKASIEQSLNEPECLNKAAEICSDIRLSLRQLNSNSDLGQVSRDWGLCAKAQGQSCMWVHLAGAQWAVWNNASSRGSAILPGSSSHHVGSLQQE